MAIEGRCHPLQGSRGCPCHCAGGVLRPERPWSLPRLQFCPVIKCRGLNWSQGLPHWTTGTCSTHPPPSEGLWRRCFRPPGFADGNVLAIDGATAVVKIPAQTESVSHWAPGVECGWCQEHLTRILLTQLHCTPGAQTGILCCGQHGNQRPSCESSCL